MKPVQFQSSISHVSLERIHRLVVSHLAQVVLLVIIVWVLQFIQFLAQQATIVELAQQFQHHVRSDTLVLQPSYRH